MDLSNCQIAYLTPDVADNLASGNVIYLDTIEPGDLGSEEKKEYIVTVYPGNDLSIIEQELENDTTTNNLVDSNIIPDRVVEVADRRFGSDIQTHFYLTFDEARKLRNDPRVQSVELNPKLNPLLKIQPTAINYKLGNFSRLGYFDSPANCRNYALHTCSVAFPPNYGVNGLNSNIDTGQYPYVLDGTGVDVVVMDDGIVVDHPEFLDATGNTRVQTIDWYAAAGYMSDATNTMPADFYTDTGSGHGTHVAGTIAGKTFGFATNARIYSMRIFGTNSFGAEKAFDLIRNFHLRKSTNPATGFRRPTIVNGSWGVTGYYLSSPPNFNPYQGHSLYLGYQLWGGTYRGTQHGLYYATSSRGVLGVDNGTYPNGSNNVSTLYAANGYSDAYDAACNAMIAAGVIHCHAAGNNGCKVEANNGVDYNNRYGIITNVVGGLPVLSNTFYHRPNSPHANASINVGSTINLSSDGASEYRASYSHFGTGVDIWAPGTGIVSSYNDTVPAFGEASRTNYEHANGYINPNYYQANDSGTSMASPQVAGVLALFLQINPGASPAACKIFLQNRAASSIMYSTGLTNDYTNSSSISGSQPLFLRNSFSYSSERTVTNGLRIENGVVDFR
ncbi:MAG: hypothetical protein EBU90_17280 [Proteobacteria bacterium]|nr:hypothetical protein [Pseudomonadota bacterium]NBP15540.1 hypothetical protein [bacterium]